jgi:hypothetical protein
VAGRIVPALADAQVGVFWVDRHRVTAELPWSPEPEEIALPFVVQFPHPGGEHRRPHHTSAPSCRGTWGITSASSSAPCAVRRGRTTAHRRRRLLGEWEAQSRVVEAWRVDGDLPALPPRAVLRGAPARTVKHQNTDPFVFGDAFLYTNCRSPSAKLRRLTPGSVLLFGSGPGAGFVLDTVFVVAEGVHPASRSASGTCCRTGQRRTRSCSGRSAPARGTSA